MALFRDDTQDIQETIAEARRAHQEGQEIFVSRIQSKYGKKRAWAASDVAELIAGVEREGWKLSHTSEGLVGDVLSQLTCIFRRR
ncbi:hypothetical protein [Streptosporangium sp. NPDC048865]|uniref:hypothetical protein n=1 Tax=Streptosporangium sp. NPDC048865 TaxID=3155766 RepID=UPI003415A6C1